MYKMIVAHKVRSLFDEVNKGNYQAMVDGLAANFEYRFLGNHPLSGRRTKHSTITAWWQRVNRLLPGGQFTVHQVIVQGHPLNTRIAVRSTISGMQPNGEPYSNDVMQFMRLRLGKVTHIETLEDTAKLERFLATLDPVAIPDAVAPPMND
jgi:ketosteroid isomerase-like protein